MYFSIFGIFTLILKINHQSYIYNIYLYSKDPYEVKFQFSINKGWFKAL